MVAKIKKTKIKSDNLSLLEEEELLKHLSETGMTDLESIKMFDKMALIASKRHPGYCFSVSDEWVEKNVQVRTFTMEK